MENHLTIQGIQNAATRIQSYIHRTPIMESHLLNELCQSEIFFKCENFQKAGVFKIRGAMNAVLSLNEETARLGVATHSSGNHGAALALAASQKGIPAYIVMPKVTPKVKQKAVASYGGEIVYCDAPTIFSREKRLAEVITKTGATFIPPYNYQDVIEGQGTIGLEICDEIPNLDFVLTPLGGGGLLSGIATSVSAVSPKTKVIGVEPRGANAGYRSLQSGKLELIENPQTIADGLRMPLGNLTFSIIREKAKEILLAEEEEIIQAMRLIWERMKIIVEPSSAVPFAALLKGEKQFQGKRIGVVLSGGNVDLDLLPWN